MLDAIDFQAQPGEMIAITGASGSGKTTLLNVLGLLDRPDAGEVRIAGIDVATAPERELRRIRATRLGFVFQDSLLDMQRTALENVVLGLRYAATPRRRRVELARRALSFTGTEDRAGARAATLSGGERQRVALARAVAHGPAVLLCDEPTGSLDDANTERVFTLLAHLAHASAAVVIVTHDLEIARRCGRWATLQAGRLFWSHDR